MADETDSQFLDDTFEPWTSKKVNILSKYTTSEKLSITTVSIYLWYIKYLRKSKKITLHFYKKLHYTLFENFFGNFFKISSC